jgi:hypothetical protein
MTGLVKVLLVVDDEPRNVELIRTSGVGTIARSTSANECPPPKLLFAATRQPGNQNGHHRM